MTTGQMFTISLMTVLLVGGLIIAIVAVYVAILLEVLRLFELSRVELPFDQEESRG